MTNGYHIKSFFYLCISVAPLTLAFVAASPIRISLFSLSVQMEGFALAGLWLCHALPYNDDDNNFLFFSIFFSDP